MPVTAALLPAGRVVVAARVTVPVTVDLVADFLVTPDRAQTLSRDTPEADEG